MDHELCTGLGQTLVNIENPSVRPPKEQKAQAEPNSRLKAIKALASQFLEADKDWDLIDANDTSPKRGEEKRMMGTAHMHGGEIAQTSDNCITPHSIEREVPQ
ncbi:hypothetical protein HAX54_042229, partial [Datura stramonium]|nr:hypothetical protein [Datura stramonium]